MVDDQSPHSLVDRLEDSKVIVGSYVFAATLVVVVNVRELILVRWSLLNFHRVFLGGFQMSLERAPLLTKGSFALYYGGENIIDQLSSESPGDKDFL